MDVGGRVGPRECVAGSGRTKMQSSLPYRHHEEHSGAGRESARRVCSTLEECSQGVDDASRARRDAVDVRQRGRGALSSAVPADGTN